MSQLRTLTGLLLGLSTSVLAAGCDSQAGSGYTGEPMLTIHGKVLQDTVDTKNLVPALGFSNQLTTPDIPAGVNIVDGHVTGSYPARFQFDVTQPPPDLTLFQSRAGIMITDGRLLMVPQDHKPFYNDVSIDYEFTADSNSTGEITTGTEVATFCDIQTKACMYRKYTCTISPCELVATSGDPALALPENRPYVGSFIPTGTGYDEGTLTSKVYYDPNDVTHRYLDVRSCNTVGLEVPSGLTEDGSLEQCTLTEQTGDPMADTFVSLSWLAKDVLVIYSTGDDPQFQAGLSANTVHLSRGYNVLQAFPPARDSALAYLDCMLDAATTAYTEYNANNGTNYTPIQDLGSNGSDADQWIWNRTADLWNGCPNPYSIRRVDGSDNDSLDIRMMSAASWLTGK